VTTSGVQLSSEVVRQLLSTVVAVKRSWTVDAELTRHPVVSVRRALVATSRSTPFHDAVVVESGAVARGRHEDAPTTRPSRRPRADPGVVRKPLLTN